MLVRLSTTIGKIQNIPNSTNAALMSKFYQYMRSNGSSENNNLKVVIAYGNFIGKDNSFYDINKKERSRYPCLYALYESL